jgi:hypothetical protein
MVLVNGRQQPLALNSHSLSAYLCLSTRVYWLSRRIAQYDVLPAYKDVQSALLCARR